MGGDGSDSDVAVIGRHVIGQEWKSLMALVVEEGEVDARDDAQAGWRSFVEVGDRCCAAPK